MAYYRPYYYPTVYSSRALLRAPIVFLGMLAGLWIVSKVQWMEWPVSGLRGWIESLISFTSAQITNYLSGANEEPVAITPERLVYVKYVIIAVFVFIGAMSRRIFLTLFVGLILGTLF